MSQTYSIACRDCKKHLWIAQSSGGNGRVYISPKHGKALYDFLTEHRKHHLVYDENCESEIGEYDEIMTKQEPTTIDVPYGEFLDRMDKFEAEGKRVERITVLKKEGAYRLVVRNLPHPPPPSVNS